MAILESSVSRFNPASNLASFRFYLNPLQALFTAISLHYLRPDLPLLISDLPLHGTSKLLLRPLPPSFSRNLQVGGEGTVSPSTSPTMSSPPSTDPTPRSPPSMAPRLSSPPSMAPSSLSSPLRSNHSIYQWRSQRPSSSLSILPPLTHLSIPDSPPYLSISHLAVLSSTISASVTHCKKGRGLIKVNGSSIELVKPEILRYKAFEPILRCTDPPMPAAAPITPSSSLEVTAFATVAIPVKEDRQIGSDPFPGASPHEIQRKFKNWSGVAANQPQSHPQTQIPTHAHHLLDQMPNPLLLPIPNRNQFYFSADFLFHLNTC